MHTYRDGVYHPTDIALRAHLVDVLGGRWTPTRADGITRWLSDSAPALWDKPPLDRVNVANGIVDVATGKIEPHTADYLSAVQLPVVFDPSAECPQIDSFIADVFPPDAGELAYELAGLLTVPDTRYELAALLVGKGANGKSTYLSLLAAFIGGRNVSHVSLQEFSSNRFAPARLLGTLANLCADLSSQRVEDSALFRALTGQDGVTAERKYGHAFEFVPFARLLFSANQIPSSADTSYAYRRRWVVVPFERSFTGKGADVNLLGKLTAPVELSGFLNRALVAYRGFCQRQGVAQSDSLAAGAAQLRAAIDPVAAFLQESTVKGASLHVAKAVLYRAFKDWADREGRGAVSAKKFNSRLNEYVPGLVEITVNGYATWRGVEHRRDPES